MEYLVTMTTHVPDGTPEQAVDVVCADSGQQPPAGYQSDPGSSGGGPHREAASRGPAGRAGLVRIDGQQQRQHLGHGYQCR